MPQTVAPLSITAAVVFVVGCSESPTRPSRTPAPSLTPYCQASASNVVCTARLFNAPGEVDGEVTATATWIVTPPGLGTFNVAGTLSPVRYGEVAIHVRYKEWMGNYSPRYLIGPGEEARFLSFLGLSVRETDKTTPIIGANVRILSGYRTGAACVTNSLGYCSIDGILGGETFAAVVTQRGYEAATFEYRVDQFGNAPFYGIELSRSQ